MPRAEGTRENDDARPPPPRRRQATGRVPVPLLRGPCRHRRPDAAALGPSRRPGAVLQAGLPALRALPGRARAALPPRVSGRLRGPRRGPHARDAPFLAAPARARGAARQGRVVTPRGGTRRSRRRPRAAPRRYGIHALKVGGAHLPSPRSAKPSGGEGRLGARPRAGWGALPRGASSMEKRRYRWAPWPNRCIVLGALSPRPATPTPAPRLRRGGREEREVDMCESASPGGSVGSPFTSATFPTPDRHRNAAVRRSFIRLSSAC